MEQRINQRRGFTIVEILVVLAVIAILAGLIMGGLRAAMGTAQKTRENSNLKQLFYAWTQYTSGSDDWLLPGYLDQATQQAWGVNYKNKGNVTLSRGLTQTYPWRLLPYLDHDYTTFLGYRDADTEDVDADVAVDWTPQPASLPTWMSGIFGQAGSGVALQPAFGYNAYYIGGWYDDSVPQFTDASWTNANNSATSGRIVATSDANITKPSDTLVFASSTYRPTGQYKATSSNEDRVPGCAWVVPSHLGPTQIWGIGVGNPQGVVSAGIDPLAQLSPAMRMASMLSPSPAPQADGGTLVVYVLEGVPLRRYNRQSSVVHADGSMQPTGAGDLLNMEHWMRAAWKPDFRHGP
jgi:prepilin-type N-terminal cleavage/methylation domain-containing protein